MPTRQRKAAKTATKTADARPTMTLDRAELWAAVADAGVYPPTHERVADYLDVHQSTLSRVLAGKRTVPASMVARLMVLFPETYPRIVRPAPAPNGRKR